MSEEQARARLADVIDEHIAGREIRDREAGRVATICRCGWEHEFQVADAPSLLWAASHEIWSLHRGDALAAVVQAIVAEELRAAAEEIPAYTVIKHGVAPTRVITVSALLARADALDPR